MARATWLSLTSKNPQARCVSPCRKKWPTRCVKSGLSTDANRTMRVLTGRQRCPSSHDNHAHDLNGIAGETRTSDQLGLLRSDM
jgi:hypothetical protein